MQPQLDEMPLDKERERFYKTLVYYKCVKPYENATEIMNAAPQTLRKRNKEEFIWTCRGITQVILMTKPEMQDECINLLNTFPWDRYSDIRLIDKEAGDHAIQAAVSRNLPKVIRYLVKDRGLDINTPNNEGKTALANAILSTPSKNLVPLLLELGADPRCKSRDGSKAADHIPKIRPLYKLLEKREEELNDKKVPLPDPFRSEAYYNPEGGYIAHNSSGFFNCIKRCLGISQSENVKRASVEYLTSSAPELETKKYR